MGDFHDGHLRLGGTLFDGQHPIRRVSLSRGVDCRNNLPDVERVEDHHEERRLRRYLFTPGIPASVRWTL